jgi:putative ABC transport system permease protein
VNAYVTLAIGAALLLALTAMVLRIGQVPLGWAPYYAVLRGGVQLSLVGLALHGVFRASATTAAVIAVMLTTACYTAATRLQQLPGAARAVIIACGAGAALTLGLVFAVGMLPRSTRYVVALSGIVIGNTMTAATLAGRHLLSGMRSRRDEIEGWLALGATSRQAVADVARQAAKEALIPAIDQTRTTGLVTLPGAFIGALLGGASPANAARFQLIVLVGLIAAEAVVAVLLMYLLGAPDHIPEPEVRGVQRL